MKTLFVSDRALRKIHTNLLLGNIEFKKLTKSEVINDITKTVELINDDKTINAALEDFLEDLQECGSIEYIKRLSPTYLCVGDVVYVAKIETGNQISYFKLTIT